MRSIETALKALEKRARKNNITAQGDYCRKHIPPPLLVFTDGEKPEGTDRTHCHLCGKPYPPDVPRVTIVFEDTSAPQTPAPEITDADRAAFAEMRSMLDTEKPQR